MPVPFLPFQIDKLDVNKLSNTLTIKRNNETKLKELFTLCLEVREKSDDAKKGLYELCEEYPDNINDFFIVLCQVLYKY